MTNEQERGLILYREQSLARIDQGPRPKIQAVVRLNSEVHSHFKIEEFLNTLNKELFKGRGEIRPLDHCYSIIPVAQQSEQSRFGQLFSVRADLNSIISTQSLRVKKDYLKIEKNESPFEELVISISEAMDIKEETYIFFTSGSLVWSIPQRDSVGNWNSKPVRIAGVSEGRFFSFYLRSVPPVEEISQALLQQVNEILGELALQGLIPNLEQSVG